MSTWAITETDGNGGKRINPNWASILIPIVTAGMTLAVSYGVYGQTIADHGRRLVNLEISEQATQELALQIARLETIMAQIKIVMEAGGRWTKENQETYSKAQAGVDASQSEQIKWMQQRVIAIETELAARRDWVYRGDPPGKRQEGR